MNIKKNALWSLLGNGLPLIAAAAFIPYILHHLGNASFGVLSLLWALIGYFSLFDVGVGRALTYEMSKLRKLNGDDLSDHHVTHPTLSSTLLAGLLITVFAGLLGATLIFFLADVMASRWLKIPSSLQHDTVLAFQVASLGIIPTTITSGLRGALEGLNNFFASNANRFANGLSTFILPAFSIYFFGSNLWIISVLLVVSRYVLCIVAYIQLRHLLQKSSIKNATSYVKPILNYGAWLTLSGVISPLMVYGDRFFVSAVVGVSQLSFYAIPQEGLQRLLIIPGAICSALLPIFVGLKNEELRVFYSKHFQRIALLMIGICFIVALLGFPVLRYWISESFANKAFPVFIILLLGVWVNSISQLPYTVLHAAGRTKITAIFHVLELPAYFAMLYLLTKQYGLLGSAIAWSLRCAIDFVLLHTALKRQVVRDELCGL